MLKDEVRAEKNLPPLPLGEGQTLKQSQTPSSFGASIPQQLPEQGVNSSDAKVQSMHPEFVVAVQKLIDDAKIGALTRVAAIHEAEHLIGNYSRTREQDALNWLQKRTNQPLLQVLPPEMQLQLEAQRKLYLEQFVKIMDDALNAPANESKQLPFKIHRWFGGTYFKCKFYCTKFTWCSGDGGLIGKRWMRVKYPLW